MARLSVVKDFLAVLAMFSLGQTLMFDSKIQQSTKLTEREQISRNNFVHLAFHSSTVAGNTLFIDGGEITLLTSDGDPKPITTTQNKTLTIDLSKSWTTSNVEYGSVDKGPSVPVLNYGTLWASPDDTSILSFGGVRSSFPYSLRIANIELWEYSGTNGWSGITSQSPASPSLTNSRPAAAASTYGNGIGYMLGGIRGNDNAPWWPLPGLLTYDMSQNTWTNESTTSAVPYSTVGGSLTFIPNFGAEGVLIAMGGEYTGAKPWMEMATNFVPFTNISIWDIASKTWYWQNATANNNSSDIPLSATMFCSAGVPGRNGTFEIFIYGGHSDTFVLSSQTPSDTDRVAQHAFNTVHVLSLPGFIWTQVDAGTAAPRTGHTCNVIGNRQLLSIGGLNPTYKLQDAQDLSDNFTQGLGIFDMVDLRWVPSYDINAAQYTTPEIIQMWYNDRTTKTAMDWSSSGVETLFNLSVNSMASNSKSATMPSTNVFVPAIVGAVVGTILLAALAMFLYRRSGKRPKEEILSDTGTGSGDTLTHGLLSHLARSRKPYLTQRQAFLHRNIKHPVSPSTTACTPRSPTNSHRSCMTQIDGSRTQNYTGNDQDVEITVGITPETWSSAQYPDHPAFLGARTHAANRGENREPHGLELPRAAYIPSPFNSGHEISSRMDIPHLNAEFHDRYQDRHRDEHISPSSEWSIATMSTARIQDDKEVYNHLAPDSASSSPRARTQTEHRSKLDVHHEAPFELE